MTEKPAVNIEEYKIHLQKAFWYISKDPYINAARGINTVIKSSEQVFSKIKTSKSKDYWAFQIEPPWIIPIKNAEGYFKPNEAFLVIGGEVAVNKGIIIKENYYLTIIKERSPKKDDQTETRVEVETEKVYHSCCEKEHTQEHRIVRRFHFDKGPGAPDKHETNNHVQFGGSIEDLASFCQYVGGGQLHYCLDNNLDPPRLPYPPLDIVLILHLFLQQFQTSIKKTFLETPEWLCLVRKSEDFQLRYYYDQILKYYSDKEDGRISKVTTLFETMCNPDFSS
jgi:hypothetical protein